MKIVKYFFEFLVVISLFAIFKIIGLKRASFLGGILGQYFGPIFRSKKIVFKNIETGLGQIQEDKRKEIVNGMWNNIGRTFAEYIFLNKLNSHSKNFVNLNGYKYLEEIKNDNTPVVFVSGHFGNFELMAMVLQKSGVKLAAIYRPLNNFFLNPVMEYLRLKYICSNEIPKGRSGTREVLKKIKDGFSIALMVDQRVGEGIKANFFNKPALTTTIPAQLALKYNCKIVPVYLERKENTNFYMTIYKPLEIQKTENYEDDIKNITLKINKKIEEMILFNPKQWLWSHNRWK